MEKGISLYLTIIILAILLAISLGVSTILLGQMGIVSGVGNSVIAFYAADTGAERVLYEDKVCRQDCLEPPCSCPSYCVGYPDACQGLPNGYQFSDSLENYASYDGTFYTNGTITAKSVGIYRGIRRAIEAAR